MLLKNDGCVNDIVEGREAVISSAYCVFEELGVESGVVFEVEVAHFSIKICQSLPSNMRTGVIRKLDSRFSIGLNNIGFDLRPALQSLTHNSIVS